DVYKRQVYIMADDRIKSLAYFRFHPINRAKNGGHGRGSNCQGKAGEDLILKVPVGTVIKDAVSGEIICDLVRPGEKFLVARGGRGGRGNASFVTPTNRAPRQAEPGQPGEVKELILELKLIADVGLIGFPNTGKSTLISKISAARPKIADYPFTTLTPNLGVVDLDENRSFVVADIPGLIEGAHLGHGLGIQFLRHIERTRLLVHLVDVSPYSGRDPVKDYFIVLEELKAYNPGLLKRRQILVANKIDLLGEDKSNLESLRQLARREKLPFVAISALKGKGVKKLISLMADELEKTKTEEKLLSEEKISEEATD
ncbi:MAG: GTPase ObgE, partial [Candidatus Aminicenantes bacterium]|nr:GTPase ObgE [Candidatus Aminicenantes bacterium]